MGLVPKTLLEWTADQLYNRVAAAVVDGAADMLLGNTDSGLARYIDAESADPALQAALLVPAANVDRQVLAPGYRAYVEAAIANPVWDALVQAIATYVRSEDGGSYASLAAYLDDVGATVHPLVAELIRRTQGEGGLTLSGAIVAAMCPQMTTAALDRVYTGAQGSLANDTTDAGDVDTADVALFTSDNHVLVCQSRSRFNRLYIQLSTLASADCEVTVKYWNGGAWATPAGLVDRTTGFSVNGGEITYTMPADWVPCNHDMNGTALDTANEGDLYTLIIQRTANTIVTPPVATWLQIVPEAVLNNSAKLYGVNQPPLAIVRITNTNTCVVTPIQGAQYDRFLCPGTVGNQLKLLALTAIAETVTLTLGYTDQDGNAATKAQSAWTGPVAAGDTANVVLDTGDTAVRAVSATTCTITTAATSGVFAVVATGYPRAIATK